MCGANGFVIGSDYRKVKRWGKWLLAVLNFDDEQSLLLLVILKGGSKLFRGNKAFEEVDLEADCT